MDEHSFKPLTPTVGLPSPSRSRSPSRSPEKRTRFFTHTVDPLLSNLSPESTLEALSAVDAVRSAEKSTHDVLAKTIANASPSDRAIGIRAALAGQKLKEWYREVRSWQWPGRLDAGLGKGFLFPADGSHQPSTSSSEKHYLGSLPTELAMQYESRVEEIRDSMDTLDVDELKEHVLDQHIPARSRPVSASSAISNISAPLSYSQLSDFSALVTATILHALPMLSRLYILLERWSVRLKVLRLIPGLRSGLSDTQASTEFAQDRINMGFLPDTDDPLFSRESFTAARSKLETKVLHLGSQMDNILDALEGHEDSLPDAWIDEMEAIESAFATWAAQAEKKALQNEWSSRFEPNDDPVPSKPSKSIPEEDEESKTVAPIFSVDSEISPIEKQQPPPATTTPNSPAVRSNGVCQRDSVLEEDLSCPKQAPHEDEHAPQLQHSIIDEEASPTTTSSTIQPIAMDRPNDSITLSDSDMTQPLLTATSSLSSVPSQLVQDENDQHASLGTVDAIENGSDPTEKPFNGKHCQVLSEERSQSFECNYITQSASASSGKTGSAEPSIEITDITHRTESDSPPLEPPPVSIDALVSPTGLEQDTEDVIGRQPEILVQRASGEANRPRSGSVESTVSSVASGYISYESSPEIKTAKAAGPHIAAAIAPSPKDDREGTNVTRSEPPFQQTPISTQTRNSVDDEAIGHGPCFNRTKGLPLERFTEGSLSPSGDVKQGRGIGDTHEVRQAALTSVEVLPKSKLRSVKVGHGHDSKPQGEIFSNPLWLRRSASSACLTRPESYRKEERPEDQFSNGRDLHEGVSLPSKDVESSPTTTPDSPTFPVGPLRPSKRSNVPSSTTPEANVPPPKPLQPKRLRPSPVITSTRPKNNRTPAPPTKSSEDQLDEKISSLLTTLPGRIHLAAASEDANDPSESGRLRQPSRNENSRSGSPASVRSSTPSLTLTPAVNRPRRSLGPTDESSVKVYHLHRSGKSAPVKLFVRSVGEDGERVMVRVGGGWADLGEYLREYVVHHGRRKVTEEKFEIKGLPPRSSSSNNYTSARLTPTPKSGRTTPVARPGSAVDIRRPSSSLSVRKTRRLTPTETELPTFTAMNFQMADQPVEDSESPPQRRLSVASSISMDGPSTPPSGTRSTSTPLGLAGPKPRSRHVSMSPESEAWVEGVMGEARKKTAPLKHQYSSGTLRNLPPVAENDPRTSPKLRSVSDFGGGPLNKRGYLRGLNK